MEKKQVSTNLLELKNDNKMQHNLMYIKFSRKTIFAPLSKKKKYVIMNINFLDRSGFDRFEQISTGFNGFFFYKKQYPLSMYTLRLVPQSL